MNNVELQLPNFSSNYKLDTILINFIRYQENHTKRLLLQILYTKFCKTAHLKFNFLFKKIIIILIITIYIKGHMCVKNEINELEVVSIQFK